jgi:hypothetical protein
MFCIRFHYSLNSLAPDIYCFTKLPRPFYNRVPPVSPPPGREVSPYSVVFLNTPRPPMGEGGSPYGDLGREPAPYELLRHHPAWRR